MKILKTLIVSILLLLLIISGVLFFIGQNLNKSTDERSMEIVLFEVEGGTSFNTIADKLESSGLIKSALFIKVYNKFSGSRSLIKKGSYNIELNSSSLEIVKQLVEGKQMLTSVVIPEGITIRKIGNILEDAGITTAKDFINSAKDGSYLRKYNIDSSTLEGFLFPDTYSFQLDYPAENIAYHMVDLFFVKLSEVYSDYLMLTGEQIYDKIILSSIIEKEYRVIEEAPIMASVYYNRLDQNWNLGSCPTIVYIIEEEQLRPHPERIFNKDLEIQSAFNTYKKKGLPPTPIANPGMVALDAVFNPAQTNYMFFVVKDVSKGTHLFTRTLRDHVQGKNAYLNNFRSK